MKELNVNEMMEVFGGDDAGGGTGFEEGNVKCDHPGYKYYDIYRCVKCMKPATECY